ncbi:YCF48-related protein [Arenimonas sp. GDDSR-1]|uniref:WD40/YVTN/BNR-like repeat-containing protein n=1 Tax=Arenimonas sp. GDDSR-1 TaxID=2950125 RepID=UPI002633677C|nr:YCF48-related protein [Arenimonas sp. GDDSR-1]
MANWPKTSWRLVGAAALLTVPFIALSLDIAEDDPSVSDSEILPKAAHSLLLDIARTDAGFVAVGERGHVLLSTDGKTWEQAAVPTRSTLTTVSAQGASVWAAGHDGVILYSADAGKSWQRQRVQPWSPDSQELTNGSPVLDTLFTSPTEGYAVGAYSLLLKTEDAGNTWTALSVGGHAAAAVDMTASDTGTFDDSALELGAESDPHLNAIARTESGTLLVMGERGAGFRSADGGASWSKLRLPYAGSMFGLLSLGGERVLAFGLRGNVYQTDNAGGSWRKIESGTDISLIGGTVGTDGTVVLVGSNGTLLARRAGEEAFTARHVQFGTGQTPALSAAVGTDSGYLLTSDLGTVNTTVQ